MFTRSNGALRRIQAMLTGLGLLTTIAAAAVAHEGHDHGAPPPAQTVRSRIAEPGTPPPLS
jgi:membrane fusion protein, heavy metal efflux system